MAYKSNESGRMEIYIRPFAGPAASRRGQQRRRRAVAGVDGGRHLSGWRPDGKELYYIGPNGAMMAAPITATGNDAGAGRAGGAVSNADLSAAAWTCARAGNTTLPRDGRFLINTVLDDASSPITLLRTGTRDEEVTAGGTREGGGGGRAGRGRGGEGWRGRCVARWFS